MACFFEYQGEKIEYSIERGNRKSISIRVSLEQVVVRAPRSISDAKIQELIQIKAEWIVRKKEEFEQKEALLPKHSYSDGDEFWYEGEKIILRRSTVSKAYLVKEDGQRVLLVPKTDSEELKTILEEWYREKAKHKISERVNYYCEQYSFGRKPNRIVIKDQKSRWGSCSTQGNLNFNYRLMMAPPAILDYVVVHELCHFLHMNHSSQFWNAVETVMPDYKIRVDWLKQNGKYLTI